MDKKVSRLGLKVSVSSKKESALGLKDLGLRLKDSALSKKESNFHKIKAISFSEEKNFCAFKCNLDKKDPMSGLFEGNSFKI